MNNPPGDAKSEQHLCETGPWFPSAYDGSLSTDPDCQAHNNVAYCLFCSIYNAWLQSDFPHCSFFLSNIVSLCGSKTDDRWNSWRIGCVFHLLLPTRTSFIPPKAAVESLMTFQNCQNLLPFVAHIGKHFTYNGTFRIQSMDWYI